MTYMCVLQGSIVSATAPIIPANYRTAFQLPLPTLGHDSRAWSALFDAQQCILKCTQYTVALKKAISTGSSLTAIQHRMLELNEEVDILLATYYWTPETSSTEPVDSSERVLAASLFAQAQIKLNSAKIKLHRYRAFLDTPIFTRRHCDLEKTTDRRPSDNSSGCCGYLLTQTVTPPSSKDVSRSSSSPESERSACHARYESPFDSNSSAKVCLKAALAIGLAFESLPYPDPTQTTNGMAAPTLSIGSNIQAPRTMPAFACCAMQSSYALLMLCHRSCNANSGLMRSPAFHSGLEELHCGIQRIITTLQNYSIAFEALDGMKGKCTLIKLLILTVLILISGQIEEAFQLAKTLHIQPDGSEDSNAWG